VLTDISTIIAPLRNLEDLNFRLYLASSDTGVHKAANAIDEDLRQGSHMQPDIQP
ncbi:hypothetical protein H0H92_010018, partial [Tricholoma furcatifolium]